MKIVILAALVLLATANMWHEDGKIKLDYDVHGDSPIGINMKATIDPHNDQNNKISTFLKLANQYIPILETMGTKPAQNLQFSRGFNFNLGFITFGGYATLELEVGWTVESLIEDSGDAYQVYYTPFVIGYINTDVNGTTFLGEVGVGAHIDYIKFYVPLTVEVFTSGKFCVNGYWNLQPSSVVTHIFANLKECQAEIIDEVVEMTPISLACSFVRPTNAIVNNINITDNHTGAFLTSDLCIF